MPLDEGKSNKKLNLQENLCMHPTFYARSIDPLAINSKSRIHTIYPLSLKALLGGDEGGKLGVAFAVRLNFRLLEIPRGRDRDRG